MTTETESLTGSKGSPTGPPQMKKNAISYISNIVIGVASTAPAYSLAATVGFFVLITGVGVHSPAIIIVSFIPLFFIATAYKAMNEVDPDCGTTFSWVTRAMSPSLGLLIGWTVIFSDIVVNANQAQIAGSYGFQLFGLDDAANNTLDVVILGVIFIVVLTWICWRGIELSALHPAVPARLRDDAAGHLLGGRADQGLRRQQPGVDARRVELVQPVQHELQRAPRRGAARGVPLLGLGHRRVGQRGVRELQRRPGQVGGRLDVRADRDLPAGDRRLPGLRRDQVPGQQPRRHLRRRSLEGRARPAALPADDLGAHVGDRRHPDDDPARGSPGAVDGTPRRAPAAVRRDPPQEPDPRPSDDLGGRAVGHLVRRDQHPLQQRARRLRGRPRLPGLHLLRVHRLRVHDLLPLRDLQVGAELRHAWR